jgi:predicted permease
VTPPRLAEWVIARSLGPDEREVVLGDLAEEFAALTAAKGGVAARRWYWQQVRLSLVPNLMRRIVRIPRRHGVPPAAASQLRGSMMEAWLQDVRYGARMLGRRPVVTTVAVLSLGLGLSLSAVVFSLLDGIVLRPLPVPDPDRLAIVLEVRPTSVNHNLPYLDFVDYRTGQRSFVDLAAHSPADFSIRVGDELRMVGGELVSGGLFAMLDVPMRAGRGLQEIDDRHDAPPVAVVSEDAWIQLTGRDPSRFAADTIVINNEPFAVVGIAARPFHGMAIGRDTRVWIPLVKQDLLDPSARSRRERRGASWLSLIGRLRPGVTRDAAAADLNRVEHALAPTIGRARPKVLTVAEGRQGDSRLPITSAQPLMLLLGAALLVLVVACANVANLLLARATERSREMAVRAALGARAGRIARLLAIETAMIGGLGAVLALATAAPIARLFVPLLGDFGRPVTLDLLTDWRLAAFVVALMIVAVGAAGLAPVIGVLRSVTADALAEGGRAISAGRQTSRLRRALVVVQCALSLALLSVALLLSRTVYNLYATPTGLDIDHVALIEVDPETARYDAARARSYLDNATAALATLPGVQAAGFGRIIPLGFGGSRMSVVVAGYRPAADEDMELNYNVVSPSYRDATGLRLVSGRWFDDRDVSDRPAVTIVNETMAERYWAAGTAVGRRIRFADAGPDVEVVGVAQDVKYRQLREDRGPSFYLPLAQMRATVGVLHVRTTGDPAPMLDTFRRTLQRLDPGVPVVHVRTLREQAAINMTDERLAMLIGVVLGSAAMLLAAIGLYAAIAYAVEQRTREIGVRVALGASSRQIRRLVVGQGIWLALIGTAIGVVLAQILGRAIAARLYGVTASDVPTVLLSAALLCVVAALASYVPARRAARIDPMDALRAE